MVRITWMYEPLCHMQPVFQDYIESKNILPVSEKYISRLICLPCYPDLSENEIERICLGLELELAKAINNAP